MTFETAIGPIGFEQHGQGEDVLLLHSLLTNRRAYDRVVPALADERRITIMDLPGYGESVSVDPSISSYATAVAALAEAIGFGPSLAVVGNGLGAFVALSLAVQHPDLVGRLVLVGVAARFPDQAKGAFDRMAALALDEGMGAVADIAVSRIFTAQYAAANPEMVAARRRALLDMDPASFAVGCQAIRDVDFAAALGGIHMPVLIVVGSDDEATPPSYGQDLASAIPGAEYVEIPGVAHAPQLQAPDQLLTVMAPFLSFS